MRIALCMQGIGVRGGMGQVVATGWVGAGDAWGVGAPGLARVVRLSWLDMEDSQLSRTSIRAKRAAQPSQ